MLSNTEDALPDALPRVRSLDGIRGLAILMVMIHHFTFLPKAGVIDTAVYYVSKLGWSGVDLFFVLSGYLITSILVQRRTDPHYFRTFYWRRVLRILPLYYFVLAVTLFVLPHFFDLGSMGGADPWFWLHLSNLYIAFNEFAHKSINITWSLAIEEQFYLFWPLVVYTVSRKQLIRVCIGVFIGTVVLRLVMGLWGAPWGMSYTFTLTRLDGLALGALLATGVFGPGKIPAGQVAKVGLAAAVVAGGTVMITQSTHMAGRIGPAVGYAALAVMWASLVWLALTTEKVAAVFSTRPMMLFGKYSYGLYLYHMPVAYITRDHLFRPDTWPRVGGHVLFGQLLFHLLAGTITLLIAMLSWALLEGPILKLKRHFRYASM